MAEFSLIFFDIDPTCTLLSAVGLILLYLFYLLFKLLLRTIWKNKNTRKCQGRFKRRRKGAFRGRGICPKEAEEGKKLLSILKSPVGQQYDTTYGRQVLCPDPRCEVCNTTSAKVSRLLSWASVEDTASSVSHLASTDPATKLSFSGTFSSSASPSGHPISVPPPEPSPPPCSILSPNKGTPLEDLLSPSPEGDSLPAALNPPMESKFQEDRFPSQPLAASSRPSSPSPHVTQETKPVTQSEAILSLVGSPGELPANILTTKDIARAGIARVSHASSEFSSQQPPAKNLSLPKLAQPDINRQLVALHSCDASFVGDTEAHLVEPGSLSFLSHGETYLERQMKNKSDFLTLNDKEKKESFLKQIKPQDQLSSKGKMVEAVAEDQGLAVTLPLGRRKGEPEELHVPQQLRYPKNSGVCLQQKGSQVVFCLPSLHHESMSTTAPSSGDGSSNLVSFNKISDASIVHESPVLPQPLHLSLPETQPETLPQTLTQSQSQTLPTAQPQVQPQPSVPTLLPSPLCQIRICGVCFHRPQNEAQTLLPSEINQLEYNVLQKLQGSMWGLPPVVQKSQGDLCPPAPSISLVSQPSKANDPQSILPGDFPLHSELREKLEHHLRKRLIQHRWGLPCRILGSLSEMKPQTDAPETSESKCSYGLSWICLFKGDSSKHLNNIGLSQSRSFHERSSEMPPLEKGVEKEQGHKPEISTKDDLLHDPERASGNSSGSDSEKKLESHSGNLSGNNSGTSVVSVGHKQLKDVLEVHLSKKFEEIHECQIPGPVRSSWHSLKVKLPLPEKCPGQMKPSVSEDSHMNISQDTSFPISSEQKILENHITSFQRQMSSGLPNKVQESIQIFHGKESPSHSFPPSPCPSSANLISGVDSKTEVSQPHRQSSSTFHADKVGTPNPFPAIDCPLSPISTLGKEGHGTLQQSPSYTSHELTENIQTKDGQQTFLPCTQSNIDKASQKQTVLVNRYSPNLPTRQAGFGPKMRDKRMSSSKNIERPQNKMTKNLEKFPVPNKSRDPIKAKELPAFQSKPSNTLKTSKLESSSVTDVTMNKVKTSQTTGKPPTRVQVPQDPESSSQNNQLFNELKCKLKNRKPSKTPGLPTDRHLDSDNLISKSLLKDSHGISHGDMADSQVLYVHLYNRGIGMQQGQVPWVPTPVLCNCHNLHFPPTLKSVCSIAPKAGKLGGGDAEQGIFQPTKKSHPAQDRVVVETNGSKSPPALSLEGHAPSEGLFRNQMKNFLQWLYHGKKCKRQEHLLRNGSSLSSSVHGRGLVKERAAFTGNMDNPKVRTDTTNVLQEKQGDRGGVDQTCPQECLSSPMKPGKTQHKAELQGQAELIRGQPFKYEVPCSQVPRATSCSQEAALAGLSYPTRNRRIKDRDRQVHKGAALQDKLLCQQHSQCMLCSESLHHQRHQVGQVPPLVPTFAEGTVLGDLSRLFKQKSLLQNFQGECFLPSK